MEKRGGGYIRTELDIGESSSKAERHGLSNNNNNNTEARNEKEWLDR